MRFAPDLDLGSPDQGYLAFCPHHTLSHPSLFSRPAPLLESPKQGDLWGQRGLLDMTTTFSVSQLQSGLSCLLSSCSFNDLSTSKLAITSLTSQKPLAFHSLQGKAQTPVFGLSAISASPTLTPSPRDSQPPLHPAALSFRAHKGEGLGGAPGWGSGAHVLTQLRIFPLHACNLL